jgi:hypothetical protein|tara:strand:- start:32 stop:1489 length:1458 start_codon:yes stop_codon:yes gene_type:complete
MKKILALCLGIVISISSYSTHLMGGQLTTTYLSSDTLGSIYYLELDLYRDTLGIDVSIYQDIEIWSLDVMGNYNLISTSTLSLGASGSVSTMSSVYGVEIYHFTDSISFPANGNYIVKWKMCCRNQAIINMSQPDSEHMSLLAYVNVNDLSPNSSPTFLAPPVIYLPTNNTWQYNPLPYDLDGDSLVWSLTVPLSSSSNSPIPDSVIGYQFLSDTILYSNSSAPFSVNSITGEITWSPKMVGNFVASLTIQEYRNGMLIGAMNRDMQFVVVSDTSNFTPQISNMQSLPTNNLGYPYVQIAPGQNYQVHLLASDADINDVVSMSSFGEPFSLTASESTFSYNFTGNGNEIEGTFSWNPALSHVRLEPYIVVFRTSDNFFYYDETVQIEVTNNSTTVENFEELKMHNIYPNPANTNFSLPLTLSKDKDIEISIHNILGVKVSSEQLNLSAGNHVLVMNFELQNGQYFVNVINKNGLIITTKKLIVAK